MTSMFLLQVASLIFGPGDSISARHHPQTSHRHLHGVERQSESVQVVEGVGLVASGFQFFTRLGSVFAEEVGGFSSS